MRSQHKSNEDVVLSFAYGRSDQANQLASLCIAEGIYALVGHAHAVLAIRHSDGTVVRFNGWYGRSQTTSKHLNLVDDFVNDEQEDDPELHEAIEAYATPQNRGEA